MTNRFGYSGTAAARDENTLFTEAPATSIQDVQVKKVLRNTYALLAMTLLFSRSHCHRSCQLSMESTWPDLDLGGVFWFDVRHP